MISKDNVIIDDLGNGVFVFRLIVGELMEPARSNNLIFLVFEDWKRTHDVLIKQFIPMTNIYALLVVTEPSTLAPKESAPQAPVE